jgi:hypothetical protein
MTTGQTKFLPSWQVINCQTATQQATIAAQAITQFALNTNKLLVDLVPLAGATNRFVEVQDFVVTFGSVDPVVAATTNTLSVMILQRVVTCDNALLVDIPVTALIPLSEVNPTVVRAQLLRSGVSRYTYANSNGVLFTILFFDSRGTLSTSTSIPMTFNTRVRCAQDFPSLI